jgi:Flp pilus assembly protein TadD
MSPTFMSNSKHFTERFYTASVDVDETDATSVDEIADCGAHEMEQGDFTAAEYLLRQGLARQPEHPACQAYLAVCLAALGRRDGTAEEMARRVVEAHPDQPCGWFALGQVYLLEGSRGAAFQYFARARELARRHPELRARLDRQDPRGKPAIVSLPREHALNALFGRIRALFGKR